MNDVLNNLDVIIICYDPYKDAIELSPYFMNKNWTNSNALYVTSNIESVSTFRTVKTDGDLSYYGRLAKGLDSTNSQYVLLLLDDYLVDQKIDNEKINKHIEYMEKNNVAYCQLYTMFLKPHGQKISKDYFLLSDKLKYRINLQPSIFRRDFLLELLNEKPVTAWDFELLLMDKRFKYRSAIFANNKSFSVTNYIDKGLVTRKAVRLLKKEGLWKKQRTVMSVWKTIKKRLSLFGSRLLPQKFKDKIKKDKIYKS